MIHTFIPFALDRNLGREYNGCMAMIGDDDHAVFLDHDACFTTPHWYRQITEAVAVDPSALFFGMANRIAAPWQRIGNQHSNDIAEHRSFGRERLAVRTLLDITHTKGAGGVCMVVSKASWRRTGGFVDGMFCVDHRALFSHRDAGLKVYLIEGLFLYHARRLDGPVVEEPKAPCFCRGPEVYPTERIAIP